jgi:hypothetical protein
VLDKSPRKGQLERDSSNEGIPSVEVGSVRDEKGDWPHVHSPKQPREQIESNKDQVMAMVEKHTDATLAEHCELLYQLQPRLIVRNA